MRVVYLAGIMLRLKCNYTSLCLTFLNRQTLCEAGIIPVLGLSLIPLAGSNLYYSKDRLIL